jgi:hypothetical protein
VWANRLPERTASMKKINIGPTKASDYFGAHVIRIHPV